MSLHSQPGPQEAELHWNQCPRAQRAYRGAQRPPGGTVRREGCRSGRPSLFPRRLKVLPEGLSHDYWKSVLPHAGPGVPLQPHSRMRESGQREYSINIHQAASSPEKLSGEAGFQPRESRPVNVSAAEAENVIFNCRLNLETAPATRARPLPNHSPAEGGRASARFHASLYLQALDRDLARGASGPLLCSPSSELTFPVSPHLS